jgi:hypothetical protein
MKHAADAGGDGGRGRGGARERGEEGDEEGEGREDGGGGDEVGVVVPLDGTDGAAVNRP